LQKEIAKAFDEFLEVDAVGGFAGVFGEFSEFHLCSSLVAIPAGLKLRSLAVLANDKSSR
jgi:hypothetical protein